MPPKSSTHLPSRTGLFGTGDFSRNRNEPIHRWYPFIEGYSADLVRWGLARTPHLTPNVLDPFGGSGTTSLAASEAGLESWYCEANPFMAWLADVKVNQANAITSVCELKPLTSLQQQAAAHKLPSAPSKDDTPLVSVDQKRNFFPPGVAQQVAATLEHIDEHMEGPTRQIARLAVATTLVPASMMVRRTDLRRRTPNDPAPTLFDQQLAGALGMIVEDLQTRKAHSNTRATCISTDARTLEAEEGLSFDLVVTSPPYLNGTNYIRNTKLEVLALGFAETESDFGTLRSNAVTAGINNVSKRRKNGRAVSVVEPIAQQLDDVSYDRRIPQLVRSYFSDMQLVFERLRRVASPGASMYFDIGDSRFAGVHVPTHDLLAEIAAEAGWRLVDTQHIRNRRSYDGTHLVQVLLQFEVAE